MVSHRKLYLIYLITSLECNRHNGIGNISLYSNVKIPSKHA